MAKQLDNFEYGEYKGVVSHDSQPAEGKKQVEEITEVNGVAKYKTADGEHGFGTQIKRDGVDVPSMELGKPNGLPYLDGNGKIPQDQYDGGKWEAWGTPENNEPPNDLAVGGIFHKLFVPPPKYPILGVDQVGRQAPDNLPRTDGAVGMTYSLNPDGKTYSSDFDNVYPYSDMSEVTDSKGNKFIRIPKFYHKITSNGDGTLKVQICHDKIDETWSTLFVNNGIEIDFMDIGKYEASNSGILKSASGVAPLVNQNIVNTRTYASANGKGYHQFDIWNYQVLQILFLVEFATTDSQSIMQGVVEAGTKVNTGLCDTLGLKTGSVGGVTSKTSTCIYRGIENLWGNVYKWVDGINFNNTDTYVCSNIAKYESDKFDSPYINIGSITADGGRVSKMSISKEILLPTQTISYNSIGKYYCDSLYSVNGGTYVLCCGGSWSDLSSAGLWYWNCGNASYANSRYGSRLCYKPIA